MYQYSNGYHCAIANTGDSVVLHFTQRAPTFNDDGHIASIDVAPIASIMMSKDMAKALGQALASLVDGHEQESEQTP